MKPREVKPQRQKIKSIEKRNKIQGLTWKLQKKVKTKKNIFFLNIPSAESVCETVIEVGLGGDPCYVLAT